MTYLEQELNLYHVKFARKKKPSGRKNETRKEKLPNQVRHDKNAAIAVGTWKKRHKKKPVSSVTKLRKPRKFPVEINKK